MKHVIIVGGGAAGMTAAIMAARHGARVTVIERMQRVGKKLLATGNGRCNLSNRRLDASRYHGRRPGFVAGVFARFGLEDTLDFFGALGVEFMEENEGRLFPVSQQASSVLDVLRYEMTRLGVAEVCDTIVQTVTSKHGKLRCVCGNEQTFEGDRVIVCAGGKSSPNLGSNGGGYKIAQALGHAIVEPFPALVQLKLDAPWLKRIAGISVPGSAHAWIDDNLRRTETGEILFTEYGVSGTAILSLSRTISESMLQGRSAQVRIDLFPALTPGELTALLQRRCAHAPFKPIDFSFVGLLHKRLIQAALQSAGIQDVQRPCGELSSDEIARIAATLKAWTFPATGTQSWMFSQVTAGGVDVDELDPATLQSRLAPGVYFAGEVIDIDGDSGGYNLQWAWSSGAVAGICAAS